MKNKNNFVAAYTTHSGTMIIDKSMHLAIKEDTGFVPLNYGIGVLFAEANMKHRDEKLGYTGTTMSMDHPYLFRMADGKTGVLATVMSENPNGDVFFWTTCDLITYTYHGLIKLKPGVIVQYPQCHYFEEKNEYIITYLDGEGHFYANKTVDFLSLSNWFEHTGNRHEFIIPKGGDGDISCIYAITQEEATRLKEKLGEFKNIGVKDILVETEAGKAYPYDSLPYLTAYYSDGSEAQIPVRWDEEDLLKIDFNTPGYYKIKGKAIVKEYPFPMIINRADPDVLFYQNMYYYISTNDDGQGDFSIRCSETIEGIAYAQDYLFLVPKVSGDMSGCNWAPELHVINDDLWMLFASGTTGEWNSVQSRMMKCSGNPLHAQDWEEPVRMLKHDGSYLCETGITLDMTYFKDGNEHYLVWAQRDVARLSGRSYNDSSNIMIAKTSPHMPYQLISEAVEICHPRYGWSRRTTEVVEGPFILKHEDKIFITFSGSGVDETYVVGLLTATSGSDLCDPTLWKETGYPILASEHVNGQYGPGHNSFTVDEFGRDVFIFHAKPDNKKGCRHISARTVHWAADGTPILYMTGAMELGYECRDVMAKIVVTGKGVSETKMRLNSVVNEFRLDDSAEIWGNISLPLKGEYGASIIWSSSREDLISTINMENDNYMPTLAGVVTRGDQDERVTLTAVISLSGVSITKEYVLTVKALIPMEETEAYFYVYFRGSIKGESEVQHIHAAESLDGLNWKDLNDNLPILKSNLGTCGVRDPYLLRSHEGDRFFLIATDLDSNGGKWIEYGTKGSKYIMVWESRDLINWSDQRMVKISDDKMGCTWAPEALYDEKTGDYIIYWSSHREDLFDKKVVQFARTRDFYTFSEPEIFVWSEDGSTSYIDTTMIKGHDGNYYRFTKNEDALRIILEVGDTPIGPFKLLESNITSIKGVEGPEIFRLNGTDKYCLMMDGYCSDNEGVGFFPLITNDIASGQFERLTTGFHMPTGAKHGGVLPVTRKEYDAIMNKWNNHNGKGSDESSAYLFVYFTGNEPSSERLYYGVSRNGFDFRSLNNNNPVHGSNLGTGCIRDPHIFKGEDGYFYILATDMKSSLGYESNYAIVIFKTSDLINFTRTTRIDYHQFKSTSSCNRAWAPQAIWCPERNAYMVYLTIQNENEDSGTNMWRHYATDLMDFNTYTEPEFMLNAPEENGSAIDGDIIYDDVNGRYIMFFDGKRIAVSDSISGEFNCIDPKTGTEYERVPMFTSEGIDMAVEGSNIYRIIDKDQWIIAADGTSFNGGCYAVAETSDFIHYRQLSQGEYSFDFIPRHGYVIPITERQLRKLFEAYGEVDLIF